jgi:RNA recognition motif-containing protein
MVKLFIGGFPLDMTEMDLAKLVSPYGDISTIKIVRDRKTKVCKGYAFIEMVNEAGAEEAIKALNGEPMDDRALTVKVSEETKPAGPTGQRPRPPAHNNYTRPANRPPADEKPRRPRKRL